MYSAFQPPPLKIVSRIKQCRGHWAHYVSASKAHIWPPPPPPPAPTLPQRYYSPFVCGGTSIIGSNFSLSLFLGLGFPLSDWTNLLPLSWPDYYILENNSQLKAALKYKRVQLTDFRNVPMEHFGEEQWVSPLLDSVTNEGINAFKKKKKVTHRVFFLADLPLKISYPPDFSDSRHYGLLLLMYVPPHHPCDHFNKIYFSSHSHTSA